jgi:hypothetical protein
VPTIRPSILHRGERRQDVHQPTRRRRAHATIPSTSFRRTAAARRIPRRTAARVSRISWTTAIWWAATATSSTTTTTAAGPRWTRRDREVGDQAFAKDYTEVGGLLCGYVRGNGKHGVTSSEDHRAYTLHVPQFSVWTWIWR